MKDMKSTPKEMSTEDKYKALHRGGKYKVLKRDGSIKIKTTGYGNGGGFKTVIKTIKNKDKYLLLNINMRYNLS